MVNWIRWCASYIRARKFANSMTSVIHSIHPDAKFKIHTKINKYNLNAVTYNIVTDDDNATGCFILIQEALGVKQNDESSGVANSEMDQGISDNI